MASNETASSSGDINTDTGLFYESVPESQNEGITNISYSVMVSIPLEDPSTSEIDASLEPSNLVTDVQMETDLENGNGPDDVAIPDTDATEGTASKAK